MKKIKWTIYDGGKFVDAGTVMAENDKAALGRVMLEQNGKLNGDTSYAFTVGELMASSYGDELGRSANVVAHGMDESKPMVGAHHFKPNPAPPTNPVWDDVRDVLQGIMARTGCDRRSAGKIWNERRNGRITYKPNEAADIVKANTGREVYCGGNPVWTQREVEILIGKIRCPAAPLGPNGHHVWNDVAGSLGKHGCVNGHERCHKCGNHRVKRDRPKPNIQQMPTPRTAKGDALRKAFSFSLKD